MEETINDKHTFISGAASSGKLPSYHLIHTNLLDRFARRLDEGAAKYGPRNYRKGLKDKEFILDRLNHAIKHLKLAQERIELDIRATDDDLAGVLCNVQFAMEYQEANGLEPLE